MKQFARDEKKQKLLQEKADMEARLARIREKEEREKKLANRSSDLRTKRRVYQFLPSLLVHCCMANWWIEG